MALPPINRQIGRPRPMDPLKTLRSPSAPRATLRPFATAPPGPTARKSKLGPNHPFAVAMPPIVARLLQDPTAVFVVLALLLVQVYSWIVWLKATRTPLRKRTAELNNLADRVRAAKDVSSFEDISVPEVAQALRAAYPSGAHDEALDPRVAFEPDRLLPPDYNVRLDSAVAGMFTAIGIIGTFIGLIIAFFGLDLGDAARSIQPLIGGMTVAFLNSLVGVFASIRWALHSRRARHEFDAASHRLLAAVEKKFSRPAHGTHVLGALFALRADIGHLGVQLGSALEAVAEELRNVDASGRSSGERLESEIRQLREATSGASENLLNSLAPRLEESFRALVDLPFERLTRSVDDFRQIVDDTASRNAATLDALHGSTVAVGEAVRQFESVMESAQSGMRTLETGVNALREGAEAAASVVTASAGAVDSVKQASASLAQASEHQAKLTTALDEATAELKGTSAALGSSAVEFTKGAERLESAAGKIQNLGTEAAESSLRAVRAELESTVAKMATALSEFGDRNVAAFDTSSERIIEALDSRVTDLTDRLSAELQTLASRLPESAAEITRAATVLKKQLDAAVRGLEQSVRSLDASTNETLVARLGEYDKLVAQAVDRFSGTLLTWDGKVGEFSEASRVFSSSFAVAQKDIGAALGAIRASSDAIARAATHSPGVAQVRLAVPASTSGSASGTPTSLDAPDTSKGNDTGQPRQSRDAVQS